MKSVVRVPQGYDQEQVRIVAAELKISSERAYNQIANKNIFRAIQATKYNTPYAA